MSNIIVENPNTVGAAGTIITPGMDAELDAAMAKKEKIREFLTQSTQERYNFNEIVAMFRKVLE